MRTFRKIKTFGTAGSTGATGGICNEAILIQNTQASTTNVTVQSLDPNKNIVYVGPLPIGANSSLIYPIFAYGWTSSAAITVYQLF
jgi:hypothetical protein